MRLGLWMRVDSWAPVSGTAETPPIVKEASGWGFASEDPEGLGDSAFVGSSLVLLTTGGRRLNNKKDQDA